MHLVSVFTEWIVAIAFVCFLLTFVADLKKMETSTIITFADPPDTKTKRETAHGGSIEI